MPLKKSLAAASAAVAGIAISVGVSASTAQAATSAVALPITHYSHMLVDPAHQHLFITSGSGSGSILVTDYSGQTVATIPGEPGATGLALSGDGSTVYAALADGEAVSAISTSTLAETARYGTGTGTDPAYVASTSGRIWFGYGAAGQGGIGSIDPGTSPATVTLNAAPGFWPAAPLVAATAGGELVAGMSENPVQLASYDVSGGTATVLAPEKTLSEAANLRSMQITPDGKDVVLASSAPYYLEVFQISDLSVAGTYPTTYYPNSVSIASDGTVATGTSGTNDIFMFAPGGTTPENTIGFGNAQLADDGAALTPDGSLLFVVTLASVPTLNIIPDPEQPVDPTRTVVTCSPGTVAIGQVRSCTATVTDTAAAGATTPTGTVTFTSSTSGGSFSSTSCTLSPASGGQASCTVSYTPAQAASGRETITGNYGGDRAHAASSGRDTIDHTSTVVNCSDGSIALGEDASCTATVTDTAPAVVTPVTTPTGTVTFTSDTSGGSFSSTSCTLSQVSRGQASCTVSYTPPQAGAGSETITGTYEGDSRHIASSGQEALTVTLRVTITSVDCQRTTPVLYQCTASVSDFSPGTPTPPTGTVSFTSSGHGVFSATQCTLTGSDTTVSCTVYYATAAGVPMKGQTITASYGGDGTHQSSWWYTTLT
jgi:hypothetical protein